MGWGREMEMERGGARPPRRGVGHFGSVGGWEWGRADSWWVGARGGDGEREGGGEEEAEERCTGIGGDGSGTAAGGGGK